MGIYFTAETLLSIPGESKRAGESEGGEGEGDCVGGAIVTMIVIIL